MRIYNKNIYLRPDHISRLNRSIKSKVKLRGSGFLDKTVEYAKNINLDDPKVKIAVALAPMVGNLLLSAGKAGYNAINNNLGHLVSDNFVPSLPGESNTHAFGFNYMGPSTSVKERINRGVQPVNLSDAYSRNHDLQYSAIQDNFRKGNITRHQADKLVRVSDNELRQGFKVARNDPSATKYEKIVNHIADKAILGKNVLENVGLMSKGKFAGYGMKKDKNKALKKLQKQAYEITGKGKHYKKQHLNKVLAKVAARIIRRKMKGGNLKGVFDDIGNFFNKDIPTFFTKTIPSPFIDGYNKTKDGLNTAYNATLGF